jgi:hypothetical protein
MSPAKSQPDPTPVFTRRQRASKLASRPFRLSIQSCIVTIQEVYQPPYGPDHERAEPCAPSKLDSGCRPRHGALGH